MIEYANRMITLVTLTKGPCRIWWAWENDEHGGPPRIWLENIQELMLYWRRVMDSESEGLRVFIP